MTLPDLRDALDRPIRIQFTTEAEDRIKLGDYGLDPERARTLASFLTRWANGVDGEGLVAPPGVVVEPPAGDPVVPGSDCGREDCSHRFKRFHWHEAPPATQMAEEGACGEGPQSAVAVSGGQAGEPIPASSPHAVEPAPLATGAPPAPAASQDAQRRNHNRSRRGRSRR